MKCSGFSSKRPLYQVCKVSHPVRNGNLAGNLRSKPRQVVSKKRRHYEIEMEMGETDDEFDDEKSLRNVKRPTHAQLQEEEKMMM